MDDIVSADGNYPEIDDFLTEILDEDEARRSIEAIQERMIDFMSVRGIEIIDSHEALARQDQILGVEAERMGDSLQELVDLNEPLPEEDRMAEVDRIVTRYTTMAEKVVKDTIRRSQDFDWILEIAAASHIDPDATDLKKEFHARLLASGRSGEWIDLIDQELEGDLLSDEESFEAIYAAIVDEAATDEVSRLSFNEDRLTVQLLMNNNGVEISVTEVERDLILTTLAFLLHCYRQDGVTRVDEARQLLDAANLVGPSWTQLLNKLFE